jgi:hypothetical protein
MNGYVAFYNGKRAEVRANDLYSAKKEAIKVFGVPRKREHMVTVMLAEKKGDPVVHTPDF